MEYLDAEVTAREKGGRKRKMAWGKVGGRPAGAIERGKRTDRDGLGSNRQEEGRAGGRAGRRKYWVRWEGMCRGTGQAVEGGGEGQTPIRFSTYNIWNRRNGGLESALRGMGQTNVDVGVFQETKLTEGIYTQKPSGYKVVTTRL